MYTLYVVLLHRSYLSAIVYLMQDNDRATVRTVGNQRRIPIEEVARLRRQRERAVERCVLYARVSSVRQE
jgi:predicted site-specific integrase-resolvase